MSKILAIDFGLKRTGLAITDDSRIIASPLTAIESNKLMGYLVDKVPKLKVSVIVLGYPLRLDGTDSHITENVRLLKEVLQKQFPDLPVLLQDERFTSMQAHQTIHLAGKKKQHKDKGLVDKLSATIILQEYLSLLDK